MANSFSYAELFEPILDEQLVAEMASSFMEVDPKNIQITGANTFKVQKLAVSGLSDYSRDSGYVSGALNLTWETLTLDQDRAKRFNVDAADADETNFPDIAIRGMSTFQRTKVAPEMDAYRFAKIFSLSNPKLKTHAYTPAAATIYSNIKAGIKAIRKVVGEGVPLRIAISYDAMAYLEASTEITRQLNIGDFSNGVINTKVKFIDDVPLFKVPDARFYSEISLLNTEAGGYTTTATSMVLNYIIIAEGAAVARSKTSGVKVITPDTNETYDGWSTYFRKRHGLWILDNSFDAVYVSYTAIASPALAITITKPTTLNKTKWAPDVAPASTETLAYKMQAGAGTDMYNDVPTGTTAYTSGTEISATAGQHMLCYQLDATGHIVKYVDHTLVSGDIGTGA